MKRLLRVAAIAAAILLAPSAAHAIDRSQCKQYGGNTNCWMPTIGDWKYSVCGEVGTFLSYAIAVCRAQGGTSTTGFDCNGLPPAELRRPTSEGDMQPFAEDITRFWQGPFCEGPTADPYTWGGVFYSPQCWGQVNGPSYTFGYESANVTTPFLVHGKKLSGTVCSTTEYANTYSGRRTRTVRCGSAGGQDYAFTSTTGGTPALCSLGVFYYPVDPKQDCETCKSSPLVGNPIDPGSGVKRQTELDYSGSGPQPLRFERVYNSRVFTMDGKQWRHNYSGHIENQEFGTVPVAAAHRPSGRLFLFRQVAGSYLPDTDIDDRLTRLSDGGGALAGWQYYDAATESTELCDAEGKLVSIANRAGLAHTLEYSTGATPTAVAPRPGLLIRVTDAFGRQLSFTYEPIGRLASMQDPAGQTYSYTYNSQNRELTQII